MFSKKKGSKQSEHERICGLNASEREVEYIATVKKYWEEMRSIFEDEADWKLDKGDDLQAGMVFSKQVKGIGRVSQAKCIIDLELSKLNNLLVQQVEQLATWDKGVSESEILQRLTSNIDIHYLVTPEMAGGIVAKRDYVNIRYQKETENHDIISVACSTAHPSKPLSKKMVRGESRAMAMCFSRVENEPNRCLLSWIMNINVGGWIPQWGVDQGLAASLMDSIANYRTKAKTLV